MKKKDNKQNEKIATKEIEQFFDSEMIEVTGGNAELNVGADDTDICGCIILALA